MPRTDLPEVAALSYSLSTYRLSAWILVQGSYAMVADTLPSRARGHLWLTTHSYLLPEIRRSGSNGLQFYPRFTD